MNRYKVTSYKPTAWTFLTQGDHYEVNHFDSDKSLEEFATSLAVSGFLSEKGVWIMPAAIMRIKQVK